MVHDSMRNLALDKRLLRRRGWIAPDELAAALEALPDASGKAEVVRSEPAEGEAGGDAPRPA